MEIRNKLAHGAPSSTREIKSETACACDEKATGFGHWIALAIASDPTK